jgi:hypothetical protein
MSSQPIPGATLKAYSLDETRGRAKVSPFFIGDLTLNYDDPDR